MGSSFLDDAEALQNLLISVATGGPGEQGEFALLRQTVLARRDFAAVAPRFLQTCRNLHQFWQFIKEQFGTYAERRTYVWGEFRPLLEAIEQHGPSPSDLVVAGAIGKFDAAHVHAAWSKAIERRSTDPDGAITMARTLLESVCKHILDEAKVGYDDSADLNRLYRSASEQLNLAPSQHTEQVFKQILGGCTAVVEGLGSLRNRLSDAHGKGKTAKKPSARHAELAVNLSGALATYLLATWDARRETQR